MEMPTSFLFKGQCTGNSAFTKLKMYHQVCNSAGVVFFFPLEPVWSLNIVIKILLAGFSAALSKCFVRVVLRQEA